MQKMQRQINELSDAFKAFQNPAPAPAPQPAPAPAGPSIEEIQAQHEAQAKSWAIERALLVAGCVDAQAALTHIKAEEVKLAEDGSIAEGLDVEAVKTAYPYLFQTNQPKPGTVSTSAASGGSGAPTGQAMTIRDGVKARAAAAKQ